MAAAATSSRSASFWLTTVVASCLAALAFALVAQHRWDMQPCPWCVLQRLIYVAIAAVALLGLMARRAPGAQRVLLVMVLLLCGCGMAAALWQHFVAVSQASCDLTLAERIVNALKLDEWLPEVFTAWASCKDAAVRLWGVPFEIWSLALYLALSGCGLMALGALRR